MLHSIIALFGSKFQVRLANNPYSLEKHSFFEYETHFTVMVCIRTSFCRMDDSIYLVLGAVNFRYFCPRFLS